MRPGTGVLAALVPLMALACASDEPEVRSRAPAQGTGDYRRELEIHGRPSAVASSPMGAVWLATMLGMLYRADSIEGDWRLAVPGTVDTSGGFDLQTGPGMIEGLAFADAQHAIAWGVITRDDVRTHDVAQVYLTSDAGATWRLVDVGTAFSIDAAQFVTSGEIWLAGYISVTGSDDAPTVIFRSRDHGRTWTSQTAPALGSPVAGLSFDTPQEALLAAMDNRLFLTKDGGRSWTRIPTPLDQRRYKRRSHDSFARFEGVAFVDGWLVVQQDGGIFRTRASTVDWKRWPADTLLFFAVDRADGRLCGVNAQLDFLRFDSSLTASTVSKGALLAPPVAMECRAGRLTAMDTDYRLYVVDGAVAKSGFPLSAAAAGPPIERVRQFGEGRWGASMHFLYTWRDSARAWYRLPHAYAGIRGYALRNADEALVWDGHGSNNRVDRRTGSTREVPTLRGYDVIGVIQTDSVWFAYGGRQQESAYRIEVARSFVGGEFRGSRPDGFVLISQDSGATWREIDSWPRGGVAALYTSPDARRLVLLSHIGSVRELRRTGDAYTARDLLLAGNDNRDAVPYVEWPSAVHFTDENRGYISGAIHHVGRRQFRTTDGGRTWMRVEEETFPFSGIIPFGKSHLGWTASRVVLLDGSVEKVIADLAGVTGEGMVSSVSRIGDRETVLVDIWLQDEPPSRVELDVRTGQWRVVSVER